MSRRCPSPARLPAVGEFRPYLLNGEHAFGTTLVLSGGVVMLDLREDELLERRKEVALSLVRVAEELASNFAAFKRAEAARHPGYAEAILGLEIESISFHDSDPESGEVCFTRETSEDVWFCGLQGVAFGGLVHES